MFEIGRSLLESRTRQGLELEQIATATMIRLRYLEALEHEEFELLPVGSYRLSFLREYAEFLGSMATSMSPSTNSRLLRLSPSQSLRSRGSRVCPTSCRSLGSRSSWRPVRLSESSCGSLVREGRTSLRRRLSRDRPHTGIPPRRRLGRRSPRHVPRLRQHLPSVPRAATVGCPSGQAPRPAGSSTNRRCDRGRSSVSVSESRSGFVSGRPGTSTQRWAVRE
jgi:hypothetical protein